MKKEIIFDCEFEITPLRFATTHCPSCNVPFNAMIYGKTENNSRIHDKIDLRFAIFVCPKCRFEFKTRGKKIIINTK